jgi:hypothetical protein
MTTARGPESGDYELSLILDGLHYTEAKETCSGLADADTQYTHIEGRLKEINAEILEIEGRYERREDAYDETESFASNRSIGGRSIKIRQRSSFAARARWDQILFVRVAYRLLAPGSEWRLHRKWFQRSALADLLGEDAEVVDPQAVPLSRPAAGAQTGGL